MLNRIFYLLFFLIITGNGVAQNFLTELYIDRYFTATVGTGQTGYFGELKHRGLFSNGLRSFSMGFETRLYDHIGARSEFIFFSLEGKDSKAADSTFEKQRNLSFKSRNIEFTLQGVYYFNKFPDQYYKRKRWDPYIAAGIGVLRYNPYAEFGGEKIFLRPLETENREYGKYSFIVPVNVGAKGTLTKVLNLIIEAGYRFTFTDYLDDVSTVYGGPYDNLTQEVISNRKDEIPIVNPEAYDQMVPGGKRGDPSDKDAYLFLNVKLEFFLPIKARGG